MKKISLFVKILIFTSFCAVIAICGLYVFAYFSPRIELKSANQFAIYDDSDNLVFQGSGSHEWVSLKDISPHFIDAVISTEDKNFYKHNGFDYLRILNALFLNFKAQGIVQGASTISQQYIKNLFLTFEKTWPRKIEEAFLTLKLEVHYNKDEILEGYLNTIDFGNGNYGVQNASKYYFNKLASELTIEEAIMLAGIPKNPNNYNPVSSMEKAINRGKIVAQSMVNNNTLDEDIAKNLFQEEIAIYGKKDKNNLQTLMYYQDAVINELKSITDIPNSLLASGGIKIYTNLNMNAQNEMEEAIINNMDENSKLQVASIIIDSKTGKILALSGGYNYALSQYNRATQAARQVGSTIKPILYYAALENNLVASSTFLSEPTSFVFSNNQTYSPANYGDKYANRDITMAAAISYSENIYAVKTHLFLGEEVLVNTAARMGIITPLQPIPSLALGTNEINMLDFANAYATLASGGFKNDLYFIRKVEDLKGNILYEKKEKKDLVINPNYTYILNELLTATYSSAFVDYSTPTGISLLPYITKKYAIKTGSTGFDSWMVGYNPDLLMLVWNGYDDSSSLSSAEGNISKKIWIETMEDILKDEEKNWYEKPDNVVGVIQNSITGELNPSNKKAFVYYYVKGTQPSQSLAINEKSNN